MGRLGWLDTLFGKLWIWNPIQVKEMRQSGSRARRIELHGCGNCVPSVQWRPLLICVSSSSRIKRRGMKIISNDADCFLWHLWYSFLKWVITLRHHLHIIKHKYCPYIPLLVNVFVNRLFAYSVNVYVYFFEDILTSMFDISAIIWRQINYDHHLK